jgi:hypothetical protein
VRLRKCNAEGARGAIQLMGKLRQKSNATDLCLPMQWQQKIQTMTSHEFLQKLSVILVHFCYYHEADEDGDTVKKRGLFGSVLDI